MSGFKDKAKAAAGTAAVVANTVGGHGPSVSQGYQVAEQQRANATSAQVESATKAAGQPTTGQQK